MSTAQFSLQESDLQDRELLGGKLMWLAEIIIRKHFYASYRDKDDLVSVAVLKALSMLESGKWDKDKGSILTYIYTGMRNEIHNYLYHQNKFKTVDIDEMEDELTLDDEYFSTDRFIIDSRVVMSVCNSLSFGKGLESRVVAYLDEIGIDTDMRECAVSSLPEISLLDKWYSSDTVADMIRRIGGMVIWQSMEFCQ